MIDSALAKLEELAQNDAQHRMNRTEQWDALSAFKPNYAET